MTRVLTKKQFTELCKKYEPIVIGNETNSKGHYWEILGFEEIDAEYHKRIRKGE